LKLLLRSPEPVFRVVSQGETGAEAEADLPASGANSGADLLDASTLGSQPATTTTALGGSGQATGATSSTTPPQDAGAHASGAGAQDSRSSAASGSTPT
jgi:hypothetical protein